MSERDDGGPAFPRALGESHLIGHTDPGAAGMSLRDWFAGQALAGMGAWTPSHGGDNLSALQAMKARALWAYEQADAMLATRTKESKP